jgi:hypothetical protein
MHLALYNGLRTWYNRSMVTKKRKRVKKRNPIAKDLRSPKYRLRVVKSKKLYKRKNATLLNIELEN